MADNGDDSFPVPDPSLQKAFDKEAGDLGLGTEARLSPFDIALCAEGGTFQTVNVEGAAPAPPVDATDDEAIRSLVEGYESLYATIFPERWRQFALDPYMVVGPAWVAQVNEQVIRELAAQGRAGALAASPSVSPRRVELADLRIVYLGEARAVATYQLEEEQGDGTIAVGNRACILFRVRDAGWRIAVATQGEAAQA